MLNLEAVSVPQFFRPAGGLSLLLLTAGTATAFLFHDDTSVLWDADMGFADHAATSTGTSSDTRELYSEHLDNEVYITDIVAQIRRPTLGIWNTATREFYLGEQRIDMYVTGIVQIGDGLPVEVGTS